MRAHHLIAQSLSNPEPFACASDYETAAKFVTDEMEGRGLITLHLHADCPVCTDGRIGQVRNEKIQKFEKIGFVKPENFRKA